MSPFNELDKHFDQLKKVERSQDVKAKALADILNAEKINQRQRLKKQKMIVGSTTLLGAMVAILLLFLYTGGFAENQIATGDNFGEDHVAAGWEVEISEVLIAKSKSEKSFEATSIATSMNTIEIADDKTFFNELARFLNRMELVTPPPVFSLPSYDMTVRVENGNPYKIKIWESQQTIYVHHIDEDHYYASTDSSGLNVFNMMNNISFPQ